MNEKPYPSLQLICQAPLKGFLPTIALYTAFAKASNDFQVTKSMYFFYLYLDLLVACQHLNTLYMKQLDAWFSGVNTLLFFFL